MLTLLIILTALLYCTSAGLQFFRVTNRVQIASLNSNDQKALTNSLYQKALIKGLAVLAITGHTIILQHSLQLEKGINLSIFTTGSLISWLVAMVLFISSLRQKVDNLFIAVFPMAALLLLCDASITQAEAKPYSISVISHILFSILSYSIFTLAAFQAVLLHKQDSALKQNSSSKLLNSLPPLQTMERLLFEMLWTGFILLSASLISGFIFVEDILGQHMAHKSALSIISWLIFATLLTGRTFYGWRGHKAIRWTIGGFLSLMLGFFGSKLVLEVFLNNTY